MRWTTSVESAAMPEVQAPKLPDGPLAMVTGRYPAMSQTFIDREVQALRARGCEVLTVTVRTPDPNGIAGGFQKEEAKRVHRLLASAWNPLTAARAMVAAMMHPARFVSMLRLAIAARPSGGATLQLRHAAYVAEAILLAEFLRRHGVVHVHNHLGDSSGTVTMLAAHQAGLPFSMTLHGPEVFAAPEVWRLDVKIARACATICISSDGRTKALRLCSEAHHHKVVVIPCGVTPGAYAPAPQRRRGHRLLFIGRLVPRKGLDVLIAAFAQVRASAFDATLDIVGDGPERENLLSLVGEAGLAGSVRFLGVRDTVGVAAALSTADLLVVPSSSEGLPVVIMEAMASSLPVIASNIDGIPELVRDGETGILVPPCDSVRLADAIIRILGDPEMACRFGSAGREVIISRHDASRNAMTLLHTIVSQNGRSTLGSSRSTGKGHPPCRGIEAVVR